MSNPLSFDFLPHRREYLETSIGTRLREDFAFNNYTPLPNVRLYNPQQAREAGFDPNKGLGWFDFRSSEIGILVFNDRPAVQAWQMATGVTVHEHLHWLWSLSPLTVGCKTESDRFVMNVFTDAANEQRAMIESRWAQKLLRRTRALLLPYAWSGDVKEPLYRAGHFTLAVHTLLSVKGGRIMRRLHKSSQPETMAKELWSLCEKQFNRKMPADQMELWLKAFSLALQAWTADSDFTRFDIAQKFIALFPQPVENPPDSPLDMGGHMNDDCERQDGPAGSSKSGKPIKSTKPDSEQNGDPSGSTSQGDSSDEKGEDEKSSNGNSSKPDSAEDDDKGGNSNGEDESGDEAAPLSFDNSTGQDEDEQQELNQIEEETRDLNRPSQTMPGVAVHGNPTDRAKPSDPSSLIKSSLDDAGALAERLRIVARPKGRIQDTRGRVVSRIIAFDPTAQKPFKSRQSPVKGFGPQVFVGFMLDTSGSMRQGIKSFAAKRAAMTVHLACAREKVNHLITTSRTLELIAGTGLTIDKGNTLIAGVSTSNGGDNYTSTLPKFIDFVLKRPEQVKVLLVLTDGEPHAKESLKPLVDDARRRGVIVIGIGLELNSKEIAGMKMIFGQSPEETVIASTSGFARLTAEVLSNAVTRGSRSRHSV